MSDFLRRPICPVGWTCNHQQAFRPSTKPAVNVSGCTFWMWSVQNVCFFSLSKAYFFYLFCFALTIHRWLSNKLNLRNCGERYEMCSSWFFSRISFWFYFSIFLDLWCIFLIFNVLWHVLRFFLDTNTCFIISPAAASKTHASNIRPRIPSSCI